MGQIIITKLQVPPIREGLLPRSRLQAQLDTVSHPRLVLVSAPAGFGKSTVVSTWAQQSDVPVAWLSLDPGDDDLARFWTYMLAALQTAGVTLPDELPALASTDAASIPTVLVNRLAKHPQPLIFVLDDYHLITDQRIQTGVSFLLEHLPTSVTLVLITRADPPFQLARLRVHRELVELRAADLRFTLDETAALLQDAMNLSLTPEDIVALDARTEGWIAGLQLAALAIQGYDDPGVFIEAFTGSHHYVGEYLAEEVFNQQPASVKQFLLETSILAQMTASLCEAVTGREDSRQVLTLLHERNIFLQPVDAAHTTYRYHHLFADLLRHRLRQTVDAGTVRDLYRRACNWHQVQGQTSTALQYAFSGKLYEEAAHLLEETWYRILHRGEFGSMRRWLATLPDDIVRASAPLSMAACWLHALSGEHDAIAARLSDTHRAWGAVESAGSIPDREAWIIIPSLLATMDALVTLDEGDPDTALDYARQALELIPDDERVDQNLLAGSATYRLAQAHLALVQPQEAVHYFTETLEYMKQGRNYIGLANTVYALTHIYLELGQADEILRLGEETLKYFTSSSLDHLPVVGMVHLALAEALFTLQRSAEANSHLEKALALAEPTGFAPILARVADLRERDERAEQPLIESLTDREMDVLRLLNEGYTNQQIADELFISEDTVKRHNTHIYGKLAVSNRTQAVLRARELSLL